MPFDWNHSKTHRDSAAFRAQHAREVTDRAGLLRRLGYGEQAAAARCLGNLAWEFEVGGGAPLSDADVKDLVAAVFAR